MDNSCCGEEKKYVGWIERPNMEEIVSESMKEVYSKRAEELAYLQSLQDYVMEQKEKEFFPNKEAESRQVGGNHYQVAKMQVWDIIDAFRLDPYTANIIKYALRFPYKAGRQDIEKLMHYAEKLHTVYDEVKEHYYAGA